jgi:hypothetical protein
MGTEIPCNEEATMRIVRVLLATVMAVPLAGCDSSQEAKRARREASEAYDAVKDYALKKKDEYAAKMGAEVQELERKTRDLRERMKTATAEGRAELEQRLKELEPKLDAARKKLDDLRAAGADAWERMKGEMDRLVNEARDGYKRAEEKSKN